MKIALWALCAIAVTPVHAAEKDKEGERGKRGSWLTLPADGMPWQHSGTELRFPQALGSFTLQSVFRDIRPEAGVALTYLQSASDIKANVVIFPCPVDVSIGKDVDAIVRKEHERLISDLQMIAQRNGYVEKQRSPLSEDALQLWENGKVPMTTQTIELVPSDTKAKSPPPALNHWVSLILYKDHYVQLSVIIPTLEMEKSKKQVDQLITQLLQCIREPALKEEMLQFCQLYLHDPFSKEGRESADTLLAFSKESPVFEVVLPGEALTPALNAVSAFSPDASLDLLRAFIVGSSMSALKGGSVDECLDEGARMFISIAGHFRKDDNRFALPFFEDLTKAFNAQRAAAFLKERMQAASKP